MTDDADLVGLIDELRPAARLALQAEYESAKNAVKIWDVAKPLEQAMDAHPEFAAPSSKFYLGKQLAFFNHHQAVNLLRVALRLESPAALAWYRRVRASKSTSLRVVAEVYGLLVKDACRFSNGVTLLPVDELPDSPYSAALQMPRPLGPGLQFPAAIMLEVDAAAEDDHKAGHERFLEISQAMRETITALVLSDRAAPTMAAAWVEFKDPDLEAAEFGRGWMTSRHEGRLPDHPENITGEMIEWVERYLGLSPEVKRAVGVPLDRLNLARRRIAPGDKAIDGSVCLEALLSGRSRGELTHRLSLRAALLLANTLAERQGIAKTVRDFYQLRSDVVHGAPAKKAAANREVADNGLRICLDVLKQVIASGAVPEPEVWELTGGPPWNRYAGQE